MRMTGWEKEEAVEQCVTGMTPAWHQYVCMRESSMFLLPILLPSSNELTADGTPSVSLLPSSSSSPPTPLSTLFSPQSPVQKKTQKGRRGWK